MKPCKKAYVFGDSHARVFHYLNQSITPIFYRFEIVSVGGATAIGLRNPNSKTDALKIFKQKIDEIKQKNSKLFFLLGEVDTGFVIWYRAQKYGEEIDRQLRDSLDAYFDFLRWVKQLGFINIIILSVPLPTIKDGQDFGEVANARREISASQIERTSLTLKYNDLLEQHARQNKYCYISTDKSLLNKKTGLIHGRFLNKNDADHHLDDRKYAKILRRSLFTTAKIL